MSKYYHVVIISNIRAWRNEQEKPIVHTSRYTDVGETIDYQNKSELRALVEGCISHILGTTQSTYYKWVGSRKTGGK